MNNYKPYSNEITTDFTVSNLKFNKKYYVFINYTLIDTFTTDDKGNYTGTITIPALTKGKHIFKVADINIVANIKNSINNIITINDDMSFEDLTSLKSINIDDSKQGIFQSFFVNNNSGMFLTKVGLMFKTKPTKNIILKLRKIIDDKVSSYVLANSTKIVNFDDIKIDEETTIEFDYPLYLDGNSEYCLQIINNDNVCELYSFNYGVNSDDSVIGSNNSKAKELGYLYSYNKKWIKDSSESISFKLYQAIFDTSKTGTLNFIINNDKSYLLPYNSLSITNGSNILTINNVNNFKINDKIYITGTDIENIDGLHNITAIGDNYVQTNNYIVNDITTPFDNFTETKVFGGSNIQVNENKSFDRNILNINNLNINNTLVTASIKSQPITRIVNTTYNLINNKKVNEFTSKQLLLDDYNTTENLSTNVRFVMNSYDSNVSPIIDLSNSNIFFLDDEVENSVYLTKNINLTSPKNKVQIDFDTIRTSEADFDIYLLLDDNEVLIENNVYSSTNTTYINYYYVYEGDYFNNCQMKIIFKGTKTAKIKNLKLKVLSN